MINWLIEWRFYTFRTMADRVRQHATCLTPALHAGLFVKLSLKIMRMLFSSAALRELYRESSMLDGVTDSYQTAGQKVCHVDSDALLVRFFIKNGGLALIRRVRPFTRSSQ